MTDDLCCPQCGGSRLTKKGVDEKGEQRWLCKDCQKKSIDNKCRVPGGLPPGFEVKKISRLTDADGEMKLEWHQMAPDAEQREILFRESILAANEKINRLTPIKAPKSTLSELANLYVITDYHYGMLAWHREGGDNWDLDIAKSVLVGCFSQMMACAPDSRVGIICNLGDFLHADSILPLTPTGGNLLDVDGRFTKIVRSALKSFRQIIDMALSKHEIVHVIMAEGNHDISSSIWLREVFSALYEDDPRIIIDTSELPYYCHQHGDTMLAFHHGHLKKPSGLTGTFAAQFPKIWGNTTKRYGHCGHLHHTEIKEDAGMTIQQHQTLSAKDAYSARHGYHATRAAQCITYHKTHGQVATNNVTPEMLG